MKQRVLVTGASGFVGYHLLVEALQNNLEVYAAVRKDSKIEHLKDLDVTYTSLDYLRVDALAAEIVDKRYDFIIHGAGVTRAISEEAYNLINATYSENLAKAAVLAGCVKKFVLIGSLAAIGPLNDLHGIITEDSRPKPITAYGRSKLLAEKKVKAVSGLNFTILRPTAVYGPRDTGIFIFFKQVSKRFEGYIGRSQQRLSFIYVADLAKASVQALYKGQKIAYNLSDGSFYDKYQLGLFTRTILNIKTLKLHLPVNFVRLIAGISEKISSFRNTAPILNLEKLEELTAANWFCSIELAKRDLGFDPNYQLEEGLRETLSWYRENKWI